MQITLIRHLPTDWNKKTWLQGRKDISIAPVTEIFQKGISQNQRTLKTLAPFDIILASRLKRTHQTAFLYGKTAETESLLDELDFGPFEGLPKSELIVQHGERWLNSPKDLVLGESLNDLEKRITTFLEKYKSYRNLLVFGHGSWIRAIVSYHQYGDINQMNKLAVDNNQCIILQFDF
ncbi:histidine phosphatase family protein [Pseudoneobacillus sp. C159]